MSRESDEIRRAAGPYAREALEGRSRFLELRLRQDPEIRKILVGAAGRIAKTLATGGASPAQARLLANIETQLRAEAGAIQAGLAEAIREQMEQAAAAGSWQSRAVLVRLAGGAGVPQVSLTGIERMYVRINRRAVEAIWRRTEGGLRVSDRIWRTANGAREAMDRIIKGAVAEGLDCVKAARLLERYCKSDVSVAAGEYPEMMKRLESRVPADLGYNALRLARTEITAAYGRATIEAARSSPAVRGIKYCLSPAHHIVDICDGLASNDEYGLGPGVYPPEDPPPYPAHPNTMSYLVTQYEDPQEFVRRLTGWAAGGSDEGLDEWYRAEYLDLAGG